MHRSYRVPSPTRRSIPPGRSSTGALDSSSSSREAYTSPRASVERVVPISEEKYVNGKLVQRNVADPSYEPHAHRRGTYEVPVVHNSTDRPADASRSAKYDDYYATPAASSPRHKKTYSVDSDGAARLVDAKSRDRDARRLVDLDSGVAGGGGGGGGGRQRDSRGYNVSSRPRRVGVEDYAGYEYTNPRDMYETTEPVRQRPRRGSVDATSSRERPALDGFGPPPRASTFRDGPPVTTRGLDRIGGGVTRHGSISDARGRSPQRFRDRGSASFSDNDGDSDDYDQASFPVAPRMAAASRGLQGAYRDGSRDYYLPVNDRFDDKRQPRASSRFEDRDLTQRGFGIRADSMDPPRARTPSLDRYGPRSSELPPEPIVRRETMPAEPSAREPAFMIRDMPESVAAPRREHDREREYIPRDSRDRASAAGAGAGAALATGAVAAGAATAREYDDDGRRGPRERDYQSDRGGALGRYDDDMPPARRERRDFDPPERRFTADDAAPPPRRERDRDRGRDDDSNNSSSHHSGLSSLLPGAMAGAAGLYAASKGKQYYDRERQQREDSSRDGGDRSREERRRDDRSRDDRSRDDRSRDDRSRDDRHRDEQRPRNRDENAAREERRRDERPPAQPPRPEDREDRDSGKEEQQNSRQLRLENPRQETLGDVLGPSRDKSAAPSPQPARVDKPAPVRRTSTEDSPPRVRHYVSKDTPAAGRSSPPEEQRALTLDADADYKRRMQAELEKRPGRQDGQRESDSDAERQRKANMARSSDAQPSSQGRESGATDNDKHEDNDSMALAPYVAPESDLEEEEQDDEGDSTAFSERSTGKRVAIVEPPKAKDLPKGILRQPTQKFPEDPNPEREGVAPLKPVPGVPQGVKWTKIDRAKVNPETLEEAHERFEERMDHVIVLRVVDKKQIEKWAARTEEIRTARHEYRHRHDHDKDKGKEREGRREREREHDSHGAERKHRREGRHRDGSDDSNSW